MKEGISEWGTEWETELKIIERKKKDIKEKLGKEKINK